MGSLGAGQSRQGRGGGRGPLLSEINVTPFVDVMLVLLIIFMVTAPLLRQSFDLSLPEAKASSGARSAARITGESFILEIKKDRNLYIEGRRLPLNQLAPKLKAIFEHRGGEPVYIQADKSVPYGFVAKILGEIKASGLTEISLVTAAK